MESGVFLFCQTMLDHLFNYRVQGSNEEMNKGEKA